MVQKEQPLCIILRKEQGIIVQTTKDYNSDGLETSLVFTPEEPPIPTILLALSPAGDSALVRMGTDENPQFARLSYGEVITLRDEIDAFHARESGYYLGGNVPFASLAEAQAAVKAYRRVQPERDMSFLPPQAKTQHELAKRMADMNISSLKLIKQQGERNKRKHEWPV